MANYRRELTINESKYLHDIFKAHVNDDGGIFTADKRKKLLGLKPEHGKYFEDTADFWSDVRAYVKSGLKDLELFFDVAHPKLIREIIYDSPKKENLDILKKTQDSDKRSILQHQIPSLQSTISSLFETHYKYKKVKPAPGQASKYSVPIEDELEWKSNLVREILVLGIDFMDNHNLISSQAHKRLADEFVDMVNVEISTGIKLSQLGHKKN